MTQPEALPRSRLVQDLQQEHAMLRQKAVLLDSTLSTAPYARLVFREKCFSLMRLLNRHMKREGPVLRLYYDRVPSAKYLPRVKDHSAEHALLRAVNELLLGGVKVSMPLVILRVSQAIEQLQEQIEEQERSLFPLIDWASVDVLPEPAIRPRGSPTISPSMSVNAILQRYPRTEEVFNALSINRAREGYESVDELAWRRGIDPSEILEQLRRVASTFPQYSTGNR